MTDAPFVERLLAHLNAAQRESIPDLPAREQELAALWAAARAAWPQIDVAADRWLGAIARGLREGESLATALPRLHGADLYLACACAAGDPAALAAFEAQYTPFMTSALRRLRLPDATVEEVLQSVREQLLVGQGRRPLIEGYAGHGQLRNWLRIVVVRAAGKALDQAGREVPVEDEALGGMVVAGRDPELEHLKGAYRSAFKESFAAALAALEPKDRTLLRQYYLDGLTVDQLAALYGVHRASPGRWLERAREALLRGTRKELMRRLQVDRDEYESIMRLIESRLDITLRSMLT